MSFANVVSALVKGAKIALISRAAVDGGLYIGADSVAWPNVDFTPPNDAPYAKVDILTNAPEVATLGRGGEDQHTGVLQIALYYPLQAGQGALISAYQKLFTIFAAGASLAYGDAEVTIVRCGMSPAGKVDSRYVTYVSVYWRARTTRPTSISEIT